MSLGRNIVILFCVAAVSRHVESGKIIAVPMPGAPSHIFIQWKVCKELIARHHEVLVLPLAFRSSLNRVMFCSCSVALPAHH